MLRPLTQNPRPITILVYHQIEEAPARRAPFRSLYVAPRTFARQMLWLKLLGYRGLSMTQLQPYLRGEKTGKVVGITFDDGYLNNLTNALPVLQKYGFSSTCYVVSGLLGKTNVWDEKIGIVQTPLMTSRQLQQWRMGGQELGSHTDQHIDLLTTPDCVSAADIARGKSSLEALTGESVAHFCYPYGRYSDQHVELVAKTGFSTATTTARSRCHAGTDLLELPRVPVVRSTTLPLFWLKLATAYEDRRRK